MWFRGGCAMQAVEAASQTALEGEGRGHWPGSGGHVWRVGWSKRGTGRGPIQGSAEVTHER